MRGIRLVLLDYDLTLMNNIYDFYDAINETLIHFGGEPVPFKVFYKMFLEYRLWELIPRGVKPETFFRYFRRIYPSKTGIPVRGVEYFLYWTRNMGLRNIIISGRECHEKRIWMELEKYGLDEYIDAIYTFFDLEILGGLEEELFDKSWMIKWVLDKYSVEPWEAVYIGDYSKDYYSSVKTGVEFIGLALSEERANCLSSIGAGRVSRDYYEALLHLLEIMRREEGGKTNSLYSWNG